MYIVAETVVKKSAPNGTLKTDIRYVGEDYQEALNVAADILDFDILHGGWEDYDEFDDTAILKKDDWYKNISVINQPGLRYWI